MRESFGIVSKNRVAHDLTGVIDSVCGHLNTSSPKVPKFCIPPFWVHRNAESHSRPKIPQAVPEYVYAQGKAFNTPGKRSEGSGGPRGRWSNRKSVTARCLCRRDPPTQPWLSIAAGMYSSPPVISPKSVTYTTAPPPAERESKAIRCPHTKPDLCSC